MTKRIVIVEDDAAIADVINIILELETYRVECFANASFIAGLSQDMPGLILLDIWLAGVDGKDICMQLKNDDSYKQIPIVIMSAHQDVALHAKEACADDYLAKPFDIKALLSMVKKYMV